MRLVYSADYLKVSCAHCHEAIAQFERKQGGVFVRDYPKRNIAKIHTFDSGREISELELFERNLQHVVRNGNIRLALLKSKCLVCGQETFAIQGLVAQHPLPNQTSIFVEDEDHMYGGMYACHRTKMPEENEDPVIIELLSNVELAYLAYPFILRQLHGPFKSENAALQSLDQTISVSLDILESQNWIRLNAMSILR